MSKLQTKPWCRRCLLKEGQGEELYRSVMEYVATIPMEEKVSVEEYDRRLGICKACDQLTNGLCALCGCFVEIRAAKINQRGVKKIW